jgi:hypothetical protein
VFEDVVLLVAVGAAILEEILGAAEAVGVAFSEGLILIAVLAAGFPRMALVSGARPKPRTVGSLLVDVRF